MFLLDGYDNCFDPQEPHFLRQFILKEFPGSKLIVTCFINKIGRTLIEQIFQGHSSFWVRYFVPFNVYSLADHLAKTFASDPKILVQHQEALKNASGPLRMGFHNPYVLSLFAKNWETASKRYLKQQPRRSVYQSFIADWAIKYAPLFSEEAHEILKEPYEILADSFSSFAATVALQSIQNHPMALEPDKEKSLGTWLNLENYVLEDCQQKFMEKQISQPNQQSLLTIADWEVIDLQRLRQFWDSSPLRKRQSETGYIYEFAHQSFFEYFLAEAILDFKTAKETSVYLNTCPIKGEVLSFIGEAYRTPSEQERLQTLGGLLGQVIENSKTDPSIAQASANAVTILNAMGVLIKKQSKPRSTKALRSRGSR